ncbi:MAG TPA: BamA/TamA family outer membrane protein, partial [Paracoccaceae bacterium]|nr:BamA/TamA family outer membrane protein [Paracoccaceae bacterium]
GTRLRLDATPFAGTFDERATTFLTLDGRASAYWALTGDARYVLAARARLATILAEDIDKVPPTRRLYSGGGDSVRGYAKDVIGPLNGNNDPVGGLAAVETGLELRARVWDDIGGALFLEAGSVSESSWPDFAEGVQVAAGVGIRYYSPVGPIRADVGVPLNPRNSDDIFQVYFSIGQAF